MDLVDHESKCQTKKCNNELCNAELSQTDRIQRFYIDGNLMMACSNKCKEVASFACLLKKNNESQILKAFQEMMTRKIPKHQSQTIIQRDNWTKSIAGVQTHPNQSTLRSTTSKDLNKNSKMLRVGNQHVYRTEMTYLTEEHEKIECSLNYIYTIEDQIKNKYPQTNVDFVWDPENSSKEI